jgi:hypothetical protein
MGKKETVGLVEESTQQRTSWNAKRFFFFLVMTPSELFEFEIIGF